LFCTILFSSPSYCLNTFTSSVTSPIPPF
jgi:hypothetical protein